jgi:threonine/homoserine/homoserine lactone efflux protein
MSFAAGLCLGDVIAVCAVAMGLGFWAETRPELFAIAKYVGVAYLLWLAIGIWNAKAGQSEARHTGWAASALAGLALCLGNPSTILIHVLLLPTVAPSGIASPHHFLLIVLTVLVAVGAVFFGTILLARQLNRVMTSPTSATLFGRITAVVIAMTSVWMVAA